MTPQRMVKDWRKLIATDPNAELSLIPIALGLLCFHLAQQRSIAPPLPTANLHSHVCRSLEKLGDRGFPIPRSWLHPIRLSDGRVVKLLDSLASDSPLELLGQVYELLQLPQHKRSQGIFYTPIAIADYIVEQTIAPPLPKILDLACGGGIFLLRAYQKLLDFHQPQILGDRLFLLQTCIFGVDIDPVAAAIAQISLLLKALERADRSVALPDLNQNICCGNAVIHPTAEILQAQFDAVIGNPPYLDAEQMTLHCPDWRQYCAQHYRSSRGNWDLFCVFIEQGLNLCRPGGVTSMIVPNKLISADYAATVRSLLAQENQLISLRDYSHLPIFSASVYPIVYVAQKQPPTRSASVHYEVMGGKQVQETHWLSYSRFLSDRLPWQLAAARSLNLSRLQELPIFGSIAQIHGAATVAEAYALQPFLAEETVDSIDSIRFVNSGTIDRYQIRWGEKPLRYLGKTFDRPVVRLPIAPALHKRLRQARSPKLIVAGMTRQLEAAIDLDGAIWPGKSTCVIREAIDLRYLLGLLNSRVVDRYFTSLFQGNRLQGGYLRVGSPQLRQLPLPELRDREDQQRRDRLVAIVQQRLVTTELDRIAVIEAQIEDLVCELYHLTDGEATALRSP